MWVYILRRLLLVLPVVIGVMFDHVPPRQSDPHLHSGRRVLSGRTVKPGTPQYADVSERARIEQAHPGPVGNLRLEQSHASLGVHEPPERRHRRSQVGPNVLARGAGPGLVPPLHARARGSRADHHLGGGHPARQPLRPLPEPARGPSGARPFVLRLCLSDLSPRLRRSVRRGAAERGPDGDLRRSRGALPGFGAGSWPDPACLPGQPSTLPSWIGAHDQTSPTGFPHDQHVDPLELAVRPLPRLRVPQADDSPRGRHRVRVTSPAFFGSSGTACSK